MIRLPFTAIARVLSDTDHSFRRTGKTSAMLRNAPPRAVVFAANEQHMRDLRQMAVSLGRDDLQFGTSTSNHLAGMRGIPFVYDHATVTQWMGVASQQQTELVRSEEECKQANNRIFIYQRERDEARQQRDLAYAEIAKIANEAPPVPVYITVSGQAEIDALKAEVARLSRPVVINLEIDAGHNTVTATSNRR